MTRNEIIQKTNEFVNGLTKHKFSQAEIDFCKAIHNERIRITTAWNSTHQHGEIENSKISRNHSDQGLWWGLLCELLVAKEYGGKMIERKWAEDQRRQNLQLLNEGHYDCKDIGKTQVRAAEYSIDSPRRVIYRPKDFHTKSTQPVIGCVINTDPKDLWAVICGFFSWKDLVDRRLEFWDDPDKRGYYAMFIPYWELTPMDKFDIKSLL